MQTVSKVSFTNDLGVIATVSFIYLDENNEWKHSASSGEVTAGMKKIIDPGTLGVPDGSKFSVNVHVFAGPDVQGKEFFLYQSGNEPTATYILTGSVLNIELKFIGIQ